ncbi:MAG: hypothetical protein K6A23_13050 [Butyrivibrio sp.]|nr:hypothetical protein [Butyrivibrio sp.]
MFLVDFTRKNRSAIALMLIVVFLTGCGFSPEKAENSTIRILEDGSITQIIIEDFEADSYDIDELKKMADSEVTAFNIANGEGSAKIQSIEQEDENVRAIMNFISDDIYTEFTEEVLFYGTVSEMLDAGYSLPGDMITPDGDPIDADQFYDKEEQHVIVLSEDINVVVPYKIEYMSNGTELVNSREANVSGVTDSLAFLLLVK